jgi:hypothetical protein
VLGKSPGLGLGAVRILKGKGNRGFDFALDQEEWGDARALEYPFLPASWHSCTLLNMQL